MMEEEKEIKAFFEEMKKADQRYKAPDFDSLIEQKKSIPWNRILAVACMIPLLMVGGYYGTQQEEGSQQLQTKIELTINHTEQTGLESLLEEHPSPESWTSPTSVLIDDF